MEGDSFKSRKFGEATYFDDLIHPVLISDRTVSTSKREAEGEILVMSFEDDDMVDGRDDQSSNEPMPGKMSKQTEKSFGLPDSKPDLTFGIKGENFPPLGTSANSSVDSIISLAQGIIHSFVVIESKGYDAPINLACKQAVRDLAVIVNARILSKTLAEERGRIRPTGACIDAVAFLQKWNINLVELWVHWHQTLKTA